MTSQLYRIKDVANKAGTTDGLVVGAGAGPWPVVGVNSEMMANVKLNGDDMSIKTHIAKVNTETKLGEASTVNTDQFALLANFYISKGERNGKVSLINMKTAQRECTMLRKYETLNNEINIYHTGLIPSSFNNTVDIGIGLASH